MQATIDHGVVDFSEEGPLKPSVRNEISCRGILFDMDGVLVDSFEHVRQHWSRWALSHSLAPATVLDALPGRRGIDVVRMFMPSVDAEVETRRIISGQLSDLSGVRPCRGARETLDALHGQRWAVVTSASRLVARARLRVADLPSPPVLVAAEDVVHGKPAPDGYLAAANALGLKPVDCIVVEDSVPGAISAWTAGMRVVAIRCASEIRDSIPVILAVASLAEIELRIEEQNSLHVSSRFP